MGAGDTHQGVVFTHDHVWPGRGRVHYKISSYFKEDLGSCKNETSKEKGGNTSPSAGALFLVKLYGLVTHLDTGSSCNTLPSFHWDLSPGIVNIQHHNMQASCKAGVSRSMLQ